jgi:predicted O-methyltransferase YrrM
VQLARPGGVILLDNAFKRGDVFDPDPNDTEALGVRRASELAHQDDRVNAVLMTVADGVHFIVKK